MTNIKVPKWTELLPWKTSYQKQSPLDRTRIVDPLAAVRRRGSVSIMFLSPDVAGYTEQKRS